MSNKQYNTALNTYNEAEALQQLLRAAHEAIVADNDRIESNADYSLDQFTITIAGVQTAFHLGGPQLEALYRFVQHVATENFYTVDFDRLTVEK